MLRIAVPNKGSLAETAALMLDEAGYAVRKDPKVLHLIDARNDVEFFYLRPRDIATYVGSGALDVGITGRDLLLDSHSEAVEVTELDFARSTFRFAGPTGSFSELSDLAGKRLATSYPGLVGDFLARADVVETGSSLRNAGLTIFGPVILESSAVLISSPEAPAALPTLLRRLQGVLVARQFVLMDYDLPVALIERATVVARGIESPTISPLRDPDWVAVRVMVRREDTNAVMDELYELGARAILVSAIHAARL
jgi:ATP phosphoribosyltransferase